MASCRTPNWNVFETASHRPVMSCEQTLVEQLQAATADGTPLAVQGGGSKAFYGRTCEGRPCLIGGHSGVIDYTPAELVISARAGTPLAEVEAVLEKEGQMLAFEPPHFGAAATLGGTIACGLSGPRRPYAGAARDFVLGVRCINGKGEVLRLGGQVMKNVAGYDLSRLLTGSLGTLAVLLDIHLKVLPRPEADVTLRQACTADEAVVRCNRWAGQPLPLTGACHGDGQLYLRLSGSLQGVAAAAATIGGERCEDGAGFWLALREQQLPFFQDATPLWRLSLPPAAPDLGLDGEQLLDWGGAQRWLKSHAEPEHIRKLAAASRGHATLYRHGDRSGTVFHPLPPGMLALHRRLKQGFDPAGILNPGRLYAEL
jgi:glycolate oxidase FAD binding subunit